MAENGCFVAKKKVLSRHGSYLCRLAFVVACSFLSRHIFMLSSLILLLHNLTLSRHSSVDVVCFMSQKKFPPPTFKLCCNSLYYVATFFLLLFSIFVMTNVFFVAIEFLQVAWICYCNRIFLCHDRVMLPCIAETEICVATYSFHVAT